MVSEFLKVQDSFPEVFTKEKPTFWWRIKISSHKDSTPNLYDYFISSVIQCNPPKSKSGLLVQFDFCSLLKGPLFYN